MARTSYLSTSTTAGKVGGVLHPSRTPAWRVSRPSKSFYDLASQPLEPGAAKTGALETGALETQRHLEVTFKTKRAEPIIQSSEANPQSEAPAHAGYKATIAPRLDDPGAPRALPSSTQSASIQHAMCEREEKSIQSVRPSGMTPAISSKRKEPLADALTLKAMHTKSKTSNPEREVAELRMLRTDRKQSTQPRVDHRVDSRSKSSIPHETLRSRTTIAASPQLQPQSTISKPPQLTDTQAAANQDAPNFREAMPVMHGFARSSFPSKQDDIRPSGNAIHIGSVDIHIHASPSPVRPMVRQVAQSATPIASITRGFAASFGLSQA